MFKAPYYKSDGKKGKARALPEAIFDGVVNEPVMHQAVKAYLNNQRQGTASAKTRSDVRGGSRKPWRQKGTGRARQGTIRAVQWEGGGVAFPPIPHSWRTRIPKKVRTLARRSALNDRAESDRVVLVDLPEMEAPKTRDLVAFLQGMELEGKTLILTDGPNRNVYLSARNLEQIQVMAFGDESVYDVLWANTVVIEKAAMDAAEAGASEDSEAKAAPKKKAPAKKKAAARRVDDAETVEAEAAPEVEAPEAEADADEATADADADASEDTAEAAADEVTDAEDADSEADTDEEKTDA